MAEPTTYTVLREGSHPPIDGKDSPWFVYRSHTVAPNAEAAIRRACDGDDLANGRYVAIPARSWKPVTVRAETTTTLRIEEAT
jgi:hypothetical protein